MFDNYKNLATSTVVSAPTPATTGTSLGVSTGEGARFPAAPFNAFVFPANQDPTPDNTEIVRVTAKVGDIFTITRTQESSTNQLILNGYKIFAGVSVKTLTDLQTAIATNTASIATNATAIATNTAGLASHIADSTIHRSINDAGVSTTDLWSASKIIAQIAAVSGGGGGGGGTLDGIFNVMDYGALGDNAADDTTAIQLAITAASVAGGIVFFPPGNYRISATLSALVDGLTFQGVFGSSKIILNDNSNVDMITIGASGSHIKYTKIKDLWLNGNRANQTSGNGVHLFGSQYGVIDNCRLEEIKQWAINADGTGGAGFGYNNWYTNSVFDQVGGDIKTSNSEAENIIGNQFTYAGGVATESAANRGLLYLTSGGNYIAHNVFGNGGGYAAPALVLANSLPTRVLNNRFDITPAEAIRIDSPGQIIVGNDFGSCCNLATVGTKDVISVGAGDNVIENNSFYNTFDSGYGGGDVDTSHYAWRYCINETAGDNNVFGNNRYMLGSGQTQYINITGANTGFGGEKLFIIGSGQIQDAITPTKGYRLRTSGTDLDFDFTGKNLNISGYYPGGDYSGTQVQFVEYGAQFSFEKHYQKVIFVGSTGADGLVWDKAANTLTVTGSASVTDDPYGAGWNGSTQVPTKNAVYDKIEALALGGGVAWGAITGTLASQTDLSTALSGKQPLDSDLTTLAGLTATTDNFIVSVASAWASRTPAQVRTTLGLVIGTNVQAWDADLDTIAGLTPTTDNFMVAAASAWASRTPAQAKTSLALVKGDVGLGNVDNTSDANKPVSTAQQTALNLKADLASPTFTGTVIVPDASFSNAKLANMATKTYKGRTSALTGVPEDVAVATLKTDLVLVKGDVGLGNVDNTSDVNKPVSTAQQTALDAKQPLDSDLTTIAGLTATTDNFIVSVSSAWASRTPAQVRTTLGLVIGTNVQAWSTILDSWAGKTVPTGAVLGTTDTQTATNKRITRRAPSVTQSATPTINTDVTDVAHITGLAQAITSMTTNLTGTPVEGDMLRIDITDNGTARAITWGTGFEASTVALPTTTVISTRLDVGFVWNTVTSKWRCVAVA